MIVLMVAIICLPYLAILLWTLQVDFSIQIWIWLLIIISLTFYSTVLPLREYKIHQGPCMNTLFQLGPVIYLNHTVREIVLGIKGEIEEMRFDWTDGNLQLLEKSTLYLNAKRQIIASESSSVKKDRSLTKKPENLKLLTEALKINPSDAPIAQIEAFLSKIEDFEIEQKKTPGKRVLVEKKEAGDDVDNYMQTLLEPQSEVVIERVGKEEIMVLPKLKKLADYGLTTSEQKKLLSSMYFYKVPLYHEEIIEGYKGLPFSKAIYILPGPFNEVLSSSPLEIYDYANYKCDARGCSVIWNCLGFMRGKYPLLLCMMSENVAKIQDIEAIKSQKLKHSTLYYLRLKILEYLLDELTYEQDPFIDRINTLESQKKTYKDKYNQLLGEYIDDTMKAGSPILEKENKVLANKLANAKKWKPISIILIGISIIAIIVMIAFMAPLLGTITAPPVAGG